MSFRSTEFADDAARDNQATNTLEIKEYGWAFGQIADMKAWIETLDAPSGPLAGKNFAVTGYSLGGHLATAVNLLMRDAGEADRITATYTFNGAGVGERVGDVPLSGIIDDFNAMRTQGSESRFSTPIGHQQYLSAREAIDGSASRDDIVQAILNVQDAKNNATAGAHTVGELDLLLAALGRVQSVFDEAERVRGITNSGRGGGPEDVASSDIEALRLDYQLAVVRAGASTRAFASGVLDGLGAAYADDRGRAADQAGLSPIFDIYGAPLPSAVANSQHHYGQATPLYIEDQPLLRGIIAGQVAWNSNLQLFFGEARLLNNNFSLNDFGDTHSLVLLIDSLSVQDALAKLDPAVSTATLNAILQSASNARASTSFAGGQGTAEGDTLERVLDGLRRVILGPSVAATAANMDGGTWADPDARTRFYEHMQELTNSPAFQALAGGITLSASGAGLANTARHDFGSMASLLALSPVAITVRDSAGQSAIEGAFQSGWGDTYTQWQADRDLAPEDRGVGRETFSNSWIADRAALLDTRVQANQANEEQFITDRTLHDAWAYEDRGTDTVLLRQPGPGGGTHHVVFGNSTAEALNGAGLEDRLYGGAGNDTLSGLGGDDYLEGNAGADILNGGEGADALYGGADDDRLNGGADTDTLYGGAGSDVLDGGQGNDTLAGGEGLDVYNVEADSGRDTVIDSDGRGRIWLAGREITGTGELQASTDATAVWVDESDDGHPITYRLDRNTHELSITGHGSTVLVRDYEAGDLGITIPGATPPTPIAQDHALDISGVVDFGIRRVWDAHYLDPVLKAGMEDDAHDYTYEPVHLRNAATAYYDPAAGLYRPVVSGLKSDDLIEGGPGAPVHRVAIWGAQGDDRIFAQTETGLQQAVVAGESDTASGTGWLWLNGGEGDDLIVGGAGNDLVAGGAGDDVLSGGAGNDILSADMGGLPNVYTNGYQDPTLTTPWFTASGEQGAVPALPTQYLWAASQLTQTATGAAVRHDTYVPLAIDALAWLDLSGLYAMQDEDLPDLEDYLPESRRTYAELHGPGWNGYGAEGGQDVIYAGAGNDTVNAGAGDDTVFAGSGNDIVAGYDGQDAVEGGSGDDMLYGDYISSTSGDHPATETIDVFGSQIVVHHTLDASRHGNDYLDGGSGDDTVVGNGADDNIRGGEGDDRLYGDEDRSMGQYSGDDAIDGGAGDDLLVGGGGADQLAGGEGDDQLLGDLSDDGVSYSGRDTLDGGAGNDEMAGGGNDDVLIGGLGDDLLSGDATELEEANTTSYGSDRLDGGEGDDTLQGDGGADVLLGGAGDDTLFGDDDESRLGLAHHGADRLEGGAGDDYLDGQGGDDQLDGGEGSDELRGGQGNDNLQGGAGRDALLGGDGDDVLDGGTGGDALYGGAGNDVLVSDGDDALAGGDGDDTYRITLQGVQTVDGEATLAATRINDTQGDNTLVIEGASIDTSQLRMFSQGGTAFLAIGGAGLVAVGPADLTTLSIEDSSGQRHALAGVAGMDAEGRLQTGVWQAGVGVRDTRDSALAQQIQGTEWADHVEGGQASDEVEAGAGNDLLLGHEGADDLAGGAGSDVLVGGAGNDTLYGGTRGQEDSERDTFVFNLGDGTDQIIGAAAPSVAARDVIEFGSGIRFEDLRVSDLRARSSDSGIQLMIEYGAGDRIVLSPGGEGAIDSIRFADGSSVAISALLAQLPPRTADTAVLWGTEADDALLGSDDNETLRGQGGDDSLDGRGGRDLLAGGAGRNTYRFGADSGSDLILPTVGEVGRLAFAGVDAATALARLDGDDLIITYGAGSFVRIAGYALQPGLAAQWQVQFGDQPVVTLGDFLQASPVEQAGALAEREQQFMDRQQWQLATTWQRYDTVNYSGGLVPAEVQQAERWVQAGQAYEFGSYLQVADRVVSQTVVYQRPVYATQATWLSQGRGPASFVPVQDWVGSIPEGYTGVFRDAPPGGVAVFNDQGAVTGYLVPRGSSGFRSGTATHIVGWEINEYTQTTRIANDTAVQTRLTGTDGDDAVQPAASGSRFPVLFRGSVDTGAGNDVITLGSGQNGYWPGTLSRDEDWGRVALSSYYIPVSQHYDRGLGAWVDAGSGDDRISGTDGHDFIIGGAGSDWMDGQAGADTYFISAQGQDIDHIADVAQYDWQSASDGRDFMSYGGDLDHPNRDVVEFDASVALADLSYRWNPVSSEGYQYQTLELFHQGREFLQIDYRTGRPTDRQVSWAGVESFRFTDGTTLDVDTLLAQLPRLPDADPYAAQTIDLSALDSDISLASLSYAWVTASDRPDVATLRLFSDHQPLVDLDYDAATPEAERFFALNGIFRFEFAGGDMQMLQDLLADAALEPSPVLEAALPDVQIDEDTALAGMSLAAAFAAPPGQALALSATLADGDPLPAWLSFDTATGTLADTPGNGEVGTWEVTVSATGSNGLSASDTFSLVVANVNDAPIASSPLLPVLRLEEGTAFSYVAAAVFHDVDARDTLTYTATLADGSPLPNWLVLNPVTGQLSGVPSIGDLAPRSVRLSATDAAGLSATADLPVEVAKAPPQILLGTDAADLLQGRSGNDLIDGGRGADTMIGGQGDDGYAVDDVADQVIELAGQGFDSVYAHINYVLPQHVEQLTLLNTAASGTGNALDNLLFGNEQSNILDGGRGADVMRGGLGDDTYVVDDAGDQTVEATGGGVDTVLASISWTLGAEVERLRLTGAAGIDATGNVLDNVLTGNVGSNHLDGAAGADVMAGGEDDDSYVVENAGDQVVELDAQGFDTVVVRGVATYALADNVEALSLGEGAVTGIGNGLANLLRGNAADNRLDGSGGADTMAGGLGSDSYVVDNAADAIVEQAAEGIDTVEASVTYALSANIENLTLLGTQAIDGTGNTLNNVLTGNAAANRLDGGAGADTLTGGAGDDVYVVDAAGDVVVERANEGIDTVDSSVSYTLGANVENLTLTGSAAIDATGNALANTLLGNAANNRLDGGTGDDLMAGGAGDDAYEVDTAGDQVVELLASGFDRVNAAIDYVLPQHVEQLTLTGTALRGTGNELANVLVGNSAANTLVAGAGNDVLAGGQGADSLDGGAGDDLYLVFQGEGRDVIADASGTDTLRFGPGMTLDSVAARTVQVNGQTRVFISVLGVDGQETSQGVELVLGANGSSPVERFEFVSDAGQVSQVKALSDLRVLSRTLNGTNSADTLTGDRNDDTIRAGVGNDVLYGRTGNDTLYGENGSDKLFGEGGDDALYGGTEADTLWGGAGNDLLDGGNGADLLMGGTGQDKLYGGNESDTLDSGEGNDLLDGANGEDALYAGAGNDVLDGGNDADLLAAGAGNDSITSGNGQDVIIAGAGNDSITSDNDSDFIDAGAGDDIISAGNGADFIAGGRGNDIIDAGADQDVISFNRGDGADTLLTSNWQRDTLSLGGGIRYADLSLRKTGNDLVLDLGQGDSVTFKGWYLDSTRRNLTTLQMVTAAVGGDYDAASSDRMCNRKVVSFDFEALVNRFDQARAASPALVSWSLAGQLNTNYRSGSDTQALGGDLAYRYATLGSGGTGSYGDLDWAGVRNRMNGLNGTQWQTLNASTLVNPWTALQAGMSLVSDATVGLPSPIAPMASPGGEELVFAAFNASGRKPVWMGDRPGALLA